MILLPPEYHEVPPDQPLIFLAGPIQEAPDWQNRATKLIRNHSQVWIANPRREYLDDQFDYNAQVDWETHHLKRAHSCGVIMFWLNRPHTINPERAYAQTSRFELAEWFSTGKFCAGQIVVGIDEGFSGGRYIHKRLSEESSIPILSSLEETVEEALWRVERSASDHKRA